MPIDQSAGDLAGDLARLIVALTTQHDDDANAPTMAIETPFSTMSQSDWGEAVECWNLAGRPLIAQLEARGCPACGAEQEQRPIFQSYDGYGYEECGRCGCWHVPLKVDAALFERFFLLCPQAAEVLRRSFHKRMSAENQQADLARFNDYFTRLSVMFDGRQGLRYLDMGCGLGNSLVAARDHGFDGVGVESSRECLKLCQEAGLQVLHDEQTPVGVFDLISFWESLEHMVDPAQMLRMSHRLLAENGVLAFTIPNLDSPLLRAQRGDCSVVHGGYDTPGHINLFGPGQVRHLLERCGFSVLHMDGQYGMSLPELAAYMLGLHRGAADLLVGRGQAQELPPTTRTLLNSIGPAVSLLERFSLTAPILFVVACRQSDAAALAAQRRAMAQRRRAELLAQGEPMAQVGTAARMIELNEHVLRVEEQARNAVEALNQEKEREVAELLEQLRCAAESEKQLERQLKQAAEVEGHLQHELQQRDGVSEQLKQQLLKAAGVQEQLEQQLLQAGGVQEQLQQRLHRAGEIEAQYQRDLQQAAGVQEQQRQQIEQQLQQLHQSQQDLLHRSEQLDRMAEALRQETAHATRREREIVDLRQVLAGLEDALSQRDAELAEQITQGQQLNLRLEAAADEQASLSAQLQVVMRSRAYRLARRLRRLLSRK